MQFNAKIRLTHQLLYTCHSATGSMLYTAQMAQFLDFLFIISLLNSLF